MTQSIVCGGCGSAVPYGRLSCPSCGELLASVAGAAQRGTTAAVADPAALAADTVAGAPADVVDGQLATWPDSNGRGLSLTDWDDEAEDPAQARPPTSATPAWSSDPMPAVEPGDEMLGATPVPAVPAPVTTAIAPPPGAYLPPVLQPAGPVAPARSWAGHGPDDQPTSADAAGVDTTDVDAHGSAAVDREKAEEFAGWLAIAGAALSLVGFLLPWSSVSVIGASGVGYFDRWGLAGPGHLLVVLGLLGVLAAAVLRARVPIWIGIGLPGLGLGALLLGLVWPYLVGPLGGSVGAMVVALGAVLLGSAGVAAIVVDRHARVDPTV